MERKWYAVYTKPRWEKKVADSLSRMGVENYCPLNKVIKKWSDRKKIVYVPLFTSYVFVQLPEKKLSELLHINGIINLVLWLGKPAVIRDEEIETIRNFLSLHADVKLQKASLQINDSIVIKRGLFTESEGKVMAVMNKTVKILLPTLGYEMVAEVHIDHVSNKHTF
jgi:transcription antitermination factor NusG